MTTPVNVPGWLNRHHPGDPGPGRRCESIITPGKSESLPLKKFTGDPSALAKQITDNAKSGVPGSSGYSDLHLSLG